MWSEFQGLRKNLGASLLAINLTQSCVGCLTLGLHVERDFNVTSRQTRRGQFCGSSFTVLRERRVIP